MSGIPYTVFFFPKKKSLYTLIRSPFVNKKSRLQFGFNLHSCGIQIKYFSFLKYDGFTKTYVDILKYFKNLVRKMSLAKYSIDIKYYKKDFFF